MTRQNEQEGQILVLFAAFLILMTAMAAVAIDVSSVYAARRAYRTAADASALAGAQELQKNVSHAVGPDEYQNARDLAAKAIGDQLGGAPDCRTVTTTTDSCAFTGTPYSATIRTPINTGECVSCAPDRSVQVTVENPTFAVSFARLFGVNSYDVSVDAVAGLSFDHSYAIETLRPPQPLGASSGWDVRDIRVDGGTHVFVSRGDVGTNSNMDYAGTNSSVQVEAGYGMYYYDPYNGPEWDGNPVGQKLPALIPDPGYYIPQRTTSTPGGTVTRPAASVACKAMVDALWADAHYKPLVPTDHSGSTIEYTMVDCYSNGIYAPAPNGPMAGVDNGRLGILEPGVYFFDGKFTVNGSLVGGYTASSEGVALVFKQTGLLKNRTGGSGVNAVVLNAGSRYGNSAGVEAGPAIFNGVPVQTNTDPALNLTVMVTPDTNCRISDNYPPLCDDQHNFTINLAGGTSLYLAGVQYAPSDNSTISGGSDGNGYVGQIISWTIFYTGNSNIHQLGPDSQGPGLLRLDGACTAPGTPCAP